MSGLFPLRVQLASDCTFGVNIPLLAASACRTRLNPPGVIRAEAAHWTTYNLLNILYSQHTPSTLPTALTDTRKHIRARMHTHTRLLSLYMHHAPVYIRVCISGYGVCMPNWTMSARIYIFRKLEWIDSIVARAPRYIGTEYNAPIRAHTRTRML